MELILLLPDSSINNIVSSKSNSATVSTIKWLSVSLDTTIDKFFHSEQFVGLEQEIK